MSLKPINEILKEMNPKGLYEYMPPFGQPIFTERDYRIVNKLFVTFQHIFPAFRHSWPTDAEFEGAKREWMKAFKQADLTDIELIKRGVDKFRILPNPFVPSPGQFIEMCKVSAEDMGLKTPEMAFREACERSHPTADKNFSHPTIKHAYDLTGNFYLSNNPRSKTFPIFEKNYTQAIKLFRENRNLNQIEQETEHHKQERREPENMDKFKDCRNRQSAMDKIKELLK